MYACMCVSMCVHVLTDHVRTGERSGYLVQFGGRTHGGYHDTLQLACRALRVAMGLGCKLERSLLFLKHLTVFVFGTKHSIGTNSFEIFVWVMTSMVIVFILVFENGSISAVRYITNETHRHKTISTIIAKPKRQSQSGRHCPVIPIFNLNRSKNQIAYSPQEESGMQEAFYITTSASMSLPREVCQETEGSVS